MHPGLDVRGEIMFRFDAQASNEPIAQLDMNHTIACVNWVGGLIDDVQLDDEGRVELIKRDLRKDTGRAKGILNGVRVLKEMDVFFGAVVSEGLLDMDKIISLGKKFEKVERKDLPAVENELLDVFTPDRDNAPLPSSAKISRAVAKALPEKPVVEKEIPVEVEEQKVIDIADVEEFVDAQPSAAIPLPSGRVLVAFKSDKENAEYVTKTVHDYEARANGDSSLALTPLFTDAKPPIMLRALQIPSGKVLLQGEGWITEQDLNNLPRERIDGDVFSAEAIAEALLDKVA